MATKKSSATKGARPTTKTAAKRRARHPMPADVRRALREHRLTPAYRARPPYQQNDYLGWITRAVRASTRTQRIAQMLSELASGGVYMKMRWSGEASARRASSRPAR